MDRARLIRVVMEYVFDLVLFAHLRGPPFSKW
jgi:hypothetical protein